MAETTNLELYVQLACLWEATARKPGNVHRYKDYSDTNYLDYVASAAAIAPVFRDAASRTIGSLVLDGVRQRVRVTPRNTNLGILLLLATLAKATLEPDFATCIETVLRQTTIDDARAIYEAIRLARPGGLGEVSQQDVSEEATLPLRDVMTMAADRDMIARQYANGFREILTEGAPVLRAGMERTGCIEGGILHAQLHLMSRYPDSLIARKCGHEQARESAERARQVLDAGWPDTSAGADAILSLDRWLRADGHRRNPGTTADLIAGSLFVLLRLGKLTPCPDIPWAMTRATP